MTQEATAGTKLDRYELLTPLGRGGMANVWVARERSPAGKQRLVAVKVLLPALARSPEFRSMFLQEGQLVRSIEHENVVRVYEVAEHQGVLYMAMEWVEGASLRSLYSAVAKRKPIPPEMAARIIADTARGLHAAHELRGWDGELRGIVHCDVSPHNVLIGLAGVPKVVDFGVANGTSYQALVDSAAVKGKFGYLSPEQASGGKVDRRSDVFSLGIVLYELTTGERLFKGRNREESLELARRCDVPLPSRSNRNYPVELEAIVLKALSPDASHRFQTGREFQRALDEFLVRQRTVVARGSVAAMLKRAVGPAIEKRRDMIRQALWIRDGSVATHLVPNMPAVTESGHSQVELPSLMDSRASYLPGHSDPPTGSVTAGPQTLDRSPPDMAADRTRLWVLAALGAVAAFSIMWGIGRWVSKPSAEPIVGSKPAVVFGAGTPAPRSTITDEKAEPGGISVADLPVERPLSPEDLAPAEPVEPEAKPDRPAPRAADPSTADAASPEKAEAPAAEAGKSPSPAASVLEAGEDSEPSAPPPKRTLKDAMRAATKAEDKDIANPYR